MKKGWWLLALVGLLYMAAPAFAADTPAVEDEKEMGQPSFLLLQDRGAAFLGITLGAGLIVFGGAAGISRIGCSAVESMARQPEASGSINGVALITAAMIEGSALFAVVVCLLAVLYN